MPARYPNLLEVRLIPAKKDIAFVEYADEESATVAKEALHNFKIDGETKMKVCVRRAFFEAFRVLRCFFTRYRMPRSRWRSSVVQIIGFKNAYLASGMFGRAEHAGKAPLRILL